MADPRLTGVDTGKAMISPDHDSVGALEPAGIVLASHAGRGQC
jgi:hypothetical protein